MAKSKANVPGINLPWEYAIFIAVIVLVIGTLGYGWFNFSGIHTVEKVVPLELVDVDSDVSTVEKEASFDLEILLSHGADLEILGFVVNGTEYDEFVKSNTEEGLYAIELTATDLIGTQLYEVEKILYQINNEDKSLSVVSEEGVASSVNMTQTHNQPVFMGVSAPSSVASGSAATITVEFDDVEGITEVVLNNGSTNVTYDSTTDFDVVDNAETIEIALAGLSVGEKEYSVVSYTYDTGSQSVRVDLTTNNVVPFNVVTALPELLSVASSVATLTQAQVTADGAFNLVITMDDVSDVYSVTVDGIKYILTTNSAVTVNTTSDTITIAMDQADTTIGTYTFTLESFQYYDSLTMQAVELTASNTGTLSVTA